MQLDNDVIKSQENINAGYALRFNIFLGSLPPFDLRHNLARIDQQVPIRCYVSIRPHLLRLNWKYVNQNFTKMLKICP